LRLCRTKDLAFTESGKGTGLDLTLFIIDNTTLATLRNIDKYTPWTVLFL